MSKGDNSVDSSYESFQSWAAELGVDSEILGKECLEGIQRLYLQQIISQVDDPELRTALLRESPVNLQPPFGITYVRMDVDANRKYLKSAAAGLRDVLPAIWPYVSINLPRLGFPPSDDQDYETVPCESLEQCLASTTVQVCYGLSGVEMGYARSSSKGKRIRVGLTLVRLLERVIVPAVIKMCVGSPGQAHDQAMQKEMQTNFLQAISLLPQCATDMATHPSKQSLNMQQFFSDFSLLLHPSPLDIIMYRSVRSFLMMHELAHHLQEESQGGSSKPLDLELDADILAINAHIHQVYKLHSLLDTDDNSLAIVLALAFAAPMCAYTIQLVFNKDWERLLSPWARALVLLRVGMRILESPNKADLPDVAKNFARIVLRISGLWMKLGHLTTNVEQQCRQSYGSSESALNGRTLVALPMQTVEHILRRIPIIFSFISPWCDNMEEAKSKSDKILVSQMQAKYNNTKAGGVAYFMTPTGSNAGDLFIKDLINRGDF